MQWEGYSFRDQTISELGAIGAPSRVVFTVLLLLVYGLMLAFGVGVWKASGRNRRLKVVGGLIVGVAVLALTVGQFAAMRMRGTEQGLAGALHLVEGMVAMLMVFSSMGIAATALGRRFRLYTIATIVLVLGFGAWSTLEVSQVEQGLATPWLGSSPTILTFMLPFLRAVRCGRAPPAAVTASTSATAPGLSSGRSCLSLGPLTHTPPVSSWMKKTTAFGVT